LQLWRIGGSFTAPVLDTLADVGVASFAVPPAVLQQGSTDTIDSLDGRLTQAVAAVDPSLGNAEAVWTQHTVSDGAGRSVVRWYELVPTHPNAPVRQSGTISDSAGFAFNGAIAPTRNGGAVIEYDTGGSTQPVLIEAESRGRSNSLGTMSSPLTVAVSNAIDRDYSCPSQPFGGSSSGTHVCRWGDFAGASVDPDSPDVVWLSSQVNGRTGAFIAGFGHQAQWMTENSALTPAATPAPTASFSVSPNPVSPGSPVTLDAGASSDPSGGAISSYTWDFGDGSPPDTRASTTHVYQSLGVYRVTLTVTAGGGTSTTSHTVTVDAPPILSFAASTTLATPFAAVSFDAGGSTDPNPGGSIASYTWNFGDGSLSAGAAAVHRFTAPGFYSVTLTVTDDRGQEATQTRTVIVDQPFASFTASPSPAIPGAPVTFNATGSKDPVASIAGYTWSFGDGAGASGAAPSHTYAAPGSYLVTLIVNNSLGQSAATSNVVTVDPPPTPVVEISPTPVSAGVPATLNATGSIHPPGTSAGYMWAFGDGGTTAGPIVSHTYAKPGTYGVTLIVVDSDGLSAMTIEHLTVRAPRLRGHLSILRGQRVTAIRQHGLRVALSTNLGGRVTFHVVARVPPAAKDTRRGVTLLRARTVTVRPGGHRVALRLSPSAVSALTAGQASSLVTTVTVVGAFGQRLMLAATLRL
jgi:PKD repeat protein